MQWTSILLMTCFVWSIGVLAPGIKAQTQPCKEPVRIDADQVTVHEKREANPDDEAHMATQKAAASANCGLKAWNPKVCLTTTRKLPNGTNIVGKCCGHVSSQFCYGGCGSVHLISAQDGSIHEGCGCCKTATTEQVTQIITLYCDCYTVPFPYTFQRSKTCNCDSC